MTFSAADKDRMEIALAEAQAALGEGEIPVGCAVFDLDSGALLTRAHNRSQQSGDMTAHAEMLALRCLTKRQRRNAALYVTLEPCPMCAGAIAMSGIKRLIYAAPDPQYGCAGSVYRLPEDPAFPNFCLSDGGLLEEKSRALLGEAFSAMRKKSE